MINFKYKSFLILFILYIFISNKSYSELNENPIDLTFVKHTSNQICKEIKKPSKQFIELDLWKKISQNNNTIILKHDKKKLNLNISYKKFNNKLIKLQLSFLDINSIPLLMLLIKNDCKILLSRLLIRDKNHRISFIYNLSTDLLSVIKKENFNPPLPYFKPLKGIEIALIDTGINYTLPSVYPHLSRDDSGHLSGYDFNDNDNLPFDVDFGRSAFFPFHHGTSVASVIIREAPEANLVVYRFPRNNMCKFDDLIKHIATRNIKIANLSMGSKNRDDWICFEKAAKENPNILFIVSAGNDGINIDKQNVFPASFDLNNILVVTSSDIFGNLANGSNFGPKSVDIMLPAEQIPVFDHRGVKSKTSGSSYAVPRLVSMAVRFLANNKNADTKEIKAALISRAVSVSGDVVRYGWIPDPLDDYLLD